MKASKSSRAAESNDPADIIARALKEKFRNSRTCYDSPGTFRKLFYDCLQLSRFKIQLLPFESFPSRKLTFTQ